MDSQYIPIIKNSNDKKKISIVGFHDFYGKF